MSVKEMLGNMARIIPDRMFLSLMYYHEMKSKINWKNPVTYNEKLQWLKLYDRNPLYTKMVDKYEAKKFISERIGTDYIIPTLGVWDCFEEINFNALPNQFVLKCTHDSGGLMIVTDKQKFDKEKGRKKISESLKRNYYFTRREWPYKNVKPRIIAEEFIGSDLQDYRIYCFHGEPKLIYSYTNESNQEGKKPEPSYCNIYDCKWNPMPFHQRTLPKDHVPRPSGLEEMLECARKLSVGIPFLRVDFYNSRKISVGELTFFPGAGSSPFYPEEWDEILGSWIKLPEKKR